MKKDGNLESAFEEYFEAGAAPGTSVTDGAKNLINTPSVPKRLNTALRRALIAAACAASAALSAVGLYFSPVVIGNIADALGGGNKAEDPSAPKIDYYGTDGLNGSEVDLYSENAPAGLGFVKKLELANNYSVNSVDGYSSSDSIAYVKAEFSAVVNASRHDAVIYAEYTQKYSVCEIFADYYGGSQHFRRGYEYLLYETRENGEPCKKLTVEKGGVKYYVAVTSSDENAYFVWLDMIINQK